MTPPYATTWAPAPYKLPEDLGVLDGSEPLLDHLKLMPRPYPEIQPSFNLYLKDGGQTKGAFMLTHNDASKWKDSIKTKLDSLYVIVHGWTGSDMEYEAKSLHGSLLTYSANIESAVLTVDWWKAASDMYQQSAVNSVVIGNDIGLLIYKLVKQQLIDARAVHLLGMDMGSHVCSIAAATYADLAEKHNFASTDHKIGKRVGRRTGFNPLAKHF